MPDEVIDGTVPVVEEANVWVAPVKPFRDVMAAPNLPLKVVQSPEDRHPRTDPLAVGQLNVTAVVEVAMLKSLPDVPVENKNVVVAKLFMLVVAKEGIEALRVLPAQDNPVPAVILVLGVSQKLFQFVVEAVSGML